MTKSFEDTMESLANDIRVQANDLRVDNFLSFVYAADIVNRYLDTELRRVHLNRTQMNILHTLVTHEGMLTPTELGRRVFRSDHAITRAVDGLEKEGLARGEGTANDRRLRKVVITRKGLDLIKNTMTLRWEISYRAMSCLDVEEAQTFSATLRRIRKHILNLMKNPSSY